MTAKKPEAQRVFDVFPANVTISPAHYEHPDGIYPIQAHGVSGAKYVNTARVIASRGIIYIAVESSTGPVLFFKEPFTEQTKTDAITRFITESGRVIAVKKDKSCGCGSRLKNWFPHSSISLSSRE